MTKRHFAISDTEYNIVTTLSNLMQGEDALHQYLKDAKESGNTELESLFGEIHDANRDFAKRLREKLHDEFMNR